MPRTFTDAYMEEKSKASAASHEHRVAHLKHRLDPRQPESGRVAVLAIEAIDADRRISELEAINNQTMTAFKELEASDICDEILNRIAVLEKILDVKP